MPKRSNDFQRLTYLIHHQLADKADVRESRFLYDSVLEQEREVDIVIETQISNYSVILSIECRGRGRPADVGWIEEMHTKHRDLPTNRLILVSESGFSANAKKKAKALHIETLTYKDAIQCDWKVLTGLPAIILGKSSVSYGGCFAIPAQTGKLGNTLVDFQQQLSFEDDSKTLSVEEFLDTITDVYLEDLGKFFAQSSNTPLNNYAVFQITFPVPKGTYLIESLQQKLEISGLFVIGHLCNETESVEMQNHSFQEAQISFGKTTQIDTGALISIVEQKDKNTGAILLDPNNNNSQIVEMRRTKDQPSHKLNNP